MESSGAAAKRPTMVILLSERVDVAETIREVLGNRSDREEETCWRRRKDMLFRFDNCCFRWERNKWWSEEI